MPYNVGIGAKDSEILVKNERVERVFYQLQKLKDFPEDTQFVTFIQEPSEKEPRRLAVFAVITPHPKKDIRAVARPQIITMTAMPYERWVEMEKQHRHYAGLSDPVRPIFAGVLRRHLNKYNQIVQNIQEAMN